jgi:PKD repeat protein
VPTADGRPYGITTGPDGNLWFAEANGNKIGRITTAGIVTEFTVPTGGGWPVDIVSGADGNLWFAEPGGNKIGRITTTGVITEFTIPTASCNPQGIASGPDGNLWFTEHDGNKIGSITSGGATCTLTCTANANPISGTPPLTVNFTATATPSNCSGSPSFSWAFGDGQTSTQQNPTHIYNSAGAYNWSMNSTVSGTTPCTKSGTITVGAPGPTISGKVTDRYGAGQSGIQVDLARSGTWVGTANADSGGNFAFGLITALPNGNYTITPVYSGHDFAPASRSVTLSGTSIVGQDFVLDPRTISGTARNASGAGLGGIQINLTGGDTKTANTNVDGTYKFGLSNSLPTGTYTITPVNAGHTFDPPSRSVTLTGPDVTGQDFIQDPAGCTLTCSASASPTSGTAPLTVSFTASATPSNCTGSVSYSWAFGDGQSSSTKNSSHIYQSAGSYAWTMTATIQGTITCQKSGTVTVSTGCTGPQISQQPQGTSVAYGGSATLGVTATGTATLHFNWYQGSSGDTTHPVGNDQSTYTTAALTATTSYWVKVWNNCNEVNSNTATVTIQTSEPSVTLVSPQPGDVAGKVMLFATGAPGSGATIQEIGFLVDGIQLGTTCQNSNSCSKTWDVHEIPVYSERHIKAFIRDSANRYQETAEIKVTVKPLITGQLVVKDPLTGQTWNIDSILPDQAAKSAINIVQGSSFVSLPVHSDGTFTSRDIDETTIPSGQVQVRCTLFYHDEVVDNIQGVVPYVFGCNPTGLSTRFSKLDAGLATITQGIPHGSYQVAYPPPIILIHGIMTCATSWSDWYDYLQNAGYLVFTPNHHSLRWSKEDEAREIVLALMNDFNGLFSSINNFAKFNLVCHSEGGVVARAVIGGYKGALTSKIAKIFTLGTPHSGTDVGANIAGAEAWGLGRDTMTCRFNPDPRYRDFGGIPVYACSGHGRPLEDINSCTVADDGIVYWDGPAERRNHSPFGIYTWGPKLDHDEVLELPFEGEAPPSLGGDAHNFCYNHWTETGLDARVDILEGTILKVLNGQTPSPRAGDHQDSSGGDSSRTSGGYESGATDTPILSESFSLAANSSHSISGQVGPTDRVSFNAWALETLVDFALSDPDGVAITPTSFSSYSGALYVSDLLGEHYAIRNPKPGAWNLHARVGSTAATGWVSATENSPWAIVGQTGELYHGPSSQVAISAKVTGDPTGISVASFQAEISDESGTVIDIVTLYDDGTHGDGAAGDGVFGNFCTAPALPGYYRIAFQCSATNGAVSVQRRATGAFFVMSEAHLFTGTFTDQAQDSDGDGAMDAIIVSADVVFLSPGDYGIGGNLTDSTGYPVSHGSVNATVTAAGPATIEIPFPMSSKACSSFVAPFSVTGLSVYGRNSSPLDLWDSAVLTQQYSGVDYACDATQSQGPVIFSVEPGYGFPGDTRTVTASGTGFQQGAQASLAGIGASITGVTLYGNNALGLMISVDSGASPGSLDLMIINPDGQSVTRTGGFTIFADQTPTVSFTAPSPVDNLVGQVIVSASASDDRGIQQVEFLVDSISTAVLPSFPYRFNWDTKLVPNGPHTLTARVTDSNYLVAQTALEVAVANPCSLTCTATATPDSGTAPLAVTFSASVAPSNCAGEVTYEWTFGDGQISSWQNPTHAYGAAGVYNWTLAATQDGATCTQAGTITVLAGIPGDCDGDGQVSIGEVQKAINMFLGSQSVGCGVDCNRDGEVSIGEVQKVINGFLGLTSSC